MILFCRLLHLGRIGSNVVSVDVVLLNIHFNEMLLVNTKLFTEKA